MFVEAGGSLPQQFYRAVGAMVTVPVAGLLTSAAEFVGPFNINVSGTPGFKYVVEVSTDMVNWVPLQTNTAPFTFVDTDADLTERFYRAVGETVVSVPTD